MGRSWYEGRNYNERDWNNFNMYNNIFNVGEAGMKVDIYWFRFVEKVKEAFNADWPRSYMGEFFKDGKHYKIYCKVEEYS